MRSTKSSAAVLSAAGGNFDGRCKPVVLPFRAFSVGRWLRSAGTLYCVGCFGKWRQNRFGSRCCMPWAGIVDRRARKGRQWPSDRAARGPAEREGALRTAAEWFGAPFLLAASHDLARFGVHGCCVFDTAPPAQSASYRLPVLARLAL